MNSQNATGHSIPMSQLRSVGLASVPTTGRAHLFSRRFVSVGILLRSKLPGNPAQDFANRSETSSAVALRHAQQCGGVREQAFAKALQGVACGYR